MTVVHSSEAAGTTVQCDGCPQTGPALCHTSLDAFKAWDTVPFNGLDVHLCPHCVDKRARGELQHDFVLRCARCDRNTIDDPELTQWWGTNDGETVCDDCFDERADAFSI